MSSSLHVSRMMLRQAESKYLEISSKKEISDDDKKQLIALKNRIDDIKFELSSIKSRVWAFLIYPDNCGDYLDVLRESSLEWCISPLHDKDLKDDGDVVKPHYHCMIAWQGPATYNQAQAISDMLSGSPVENVRNVKAYYRYFDHSKVSEKVKYDKRDIVCGGGFDPDNYDKPTKKEMLQMSLEVQNIICYKNMTNFLQLCEYLASYDLDLYEYASSHVIEVKAKCGGQLAKTISFKHKSI